MKLFRCFAMLIIIRVAISKPTCTSNKSKKISSHNRKFTSAQAKAFYPYYYYLVSDDGCRDNGACADPSGDGGAHGDSGYPSDSSNCGQKGDFAHIDNIDNDSGRSNCHICAPKCKPHKKMNYFVQKAALDAVTSAEKQKAAGKAASQGVKLRLAQEAQWAAQPAKTELAGRKRIRDLLRKQVRKLEKRLKTDATELKYAQYICAEDAQLAKGAEKELEVINEAIKDMLINIKMDEQLPDMAEQRFADGLKTLEAAKCRYDKISQEVKCAWDKFIKSKETAYRAAFAASEARVQAEKARCGLQNG